MTPDHGTDQPAQIVDAARVADLARQAAESPRLRSHLLLHASHADAVQRLLIMAEPGTYMRPHRHSEQWELITLVQGRAALLLFAPEGRVAQRIDLGANAARAVEIPPGVVHAAVVLERGTLLLEVKPGPYRPNEFVDWAPAEGDPAAPAFAAWAHGAEAGAAAPG